MAQEIPLRSVVDEFKSDSINALMFVRATDFIGAETIVVNNEIPLYSSDIVSHNPYSEEYALNEKNFNKWITNSTVGIDEINAIKEQFLDNADLENEEENYVYQWLKGIDNDTKMKTDTVALMAPNVEKPDTIIESENLSLCDEDGIDEYMRYENYLRKYYWFVKSTLSLIGTYNVEMSAINNSEIVKLYYDSVNGWYFVYESFRVFNHKRKFNSMAAINYSKFQVPEVIMKEIVPGGGKTSSIMTAADALVDHKKF
ncbi:14256_t:CDS:2 [Cetraspora pellucida]|uniref:14256_t:CDS:1 n=1 Tax=Cetraspora pellucida TaxID=1433469 RepID=A0A9N9E0C4_9GLOM|nr:14256_t:CDS:2 [Cetraspora pellucida]